MRCCCCCGCKFSLDLETELRRVRPAGLPQMLLKDDSSAQIFWTCDALRLGRRRQVSMFGTAVGLSLVQLTAGAPHHIRTQPDASPPPPTQAALAAPASNTDQSIIPARHCIYKACVLATAAAAQNGALILLSR